MIKKVLSLFCLLVLLCYSCTQKTTTQLAESKNDSVKRYLDLAGNDTLPFNDRIKYTDKAYSIIDLNTNDTVTRYNIYSISYKYFMLNNNKKQKETADKHLLLSLQSNDPLNIARAYRNLGLYYRSMSKNEMAIDYFFKAKKIFKAINRAEYVIKTLEDIAITQSYASDFFGSNKTVLQLLDIANKTANPKIYKFCYLKLAMNLSLLKNDKEAILYYKKAEKLLETPLNRAIFNNNITDSYIVLKQYNNATKYNNQNIKDQKLLSYNPETYYIAFSKSAYLQLLSNHLTNVENKFNRAEKYLKLYNAQSCRNYNQVYLSMYYEKIKDTTNAIIAAKKAVSLSKSYKNPEDVLQCLQQLIKVDKKNATANALEYININDSLKVAERNFRDRFARIAYETNEISQEKNKAVRQKWFIVGVAFILLLIVILLLIINHQRAKNKEAALLQEQQIANEKIYNLMLTQKAKEDEARQIEKKRIALELHDGIMNKLASTRLNLSVLSHKSDPETINNCLKYVDDIYQIEQEIRNVSHDLNHEVFNKEDSFITLLENFVIDLNNNNKTHYTLELDPDINWNMISSELKMHLYRIIQEASHNSTKHAQATKAIITFTIDEPNICLSITDNGIGFDTKASLKGIGIQNMKTRVKALNGKFSIISLTQTATSINIAIPIK